ncbi:hypothetical protein HK405_011851 [Cladochytrium tenue]|nr:hypothetical protein HK405_011851 [Cladochytrium tenue]
MDALPAEVRWRVLSAAGPLTEWLYAIGGGIDDNDRPFFPKYTAEGASRHVHGEISAGEQEEELMASTVEAWRSVWLDAFDLDWPGDLTLLPPASGLPNQHQGLLRVRSQSMYERLVHRFPNLDNLGMYWPLSDPANILHLEREPVHLQSIAARNGWWSMLGDEVFSPAVRGEAIVYGLVFAHRDFLLRLETLGPAELLDHAYSALALSSGSADPAFAEFLLAAGADLTHDAPDQAARTGNLPLLRHFLDNHREAVAPSVLTAARRDTDLDRRYDHVDEGDGQNDARANAVLGLLSEYGLCQESDWGEWTDSCRRAANFVDFSMIYDGGCEDSDSESDGSGGGDDE